MTIENITTPEERKLVAVYLTSGVCPNVIWFMVDGKPKVQDLSNGEAPRSCFFDTLEGLLPNGYKPIYEGDTIEVKFERTF